MSASPMATIDPATRDLAAVLAAYPEVFKQAKLRRRQRTAILLVIAAYLLFAAWFFDITPYRLFGGLGNMGIVIRSMVVWKNVATWDYASLFQGMIETIAMAFLGTLLASLLAFPFTFLAARNIVKPVLPRHAARRFLDLMRGVDQLVWALVFVRAVGLGPLAGVLALIASSIGDLGKVYSESVEDIDQKPIEGVRSTGASRAQELRFGLLPQVLPVLLSQTLYMFEHNVRSATVLGIVGAGGIGLQLSERIRVQYWDQACFIIILIVVTVALIDLFAAFVRHRFIGKPVAARF
ncbi:phosphonate transport system permease protein [Arboricoccus pini]|uniref:Phosphonate transport system permease protein n=1 Tax=Arboricoccus pini TaxID=1963835 RepID=A0A212RZA8_9PROT|nr:phosphonate ABC transporter, permease protein PhnE [Arboricoccus pini]SNB78218.1 phosphonate transport system permease protein [Arboricoccus pini]